MVIKFPAIDPNIPIAPMIKIPIHSLKFPSILNRIDDEINVPQTIAEIIKTNGQFIKLNSKNGKRIPIPRFDHTCPEKENGKLLFNTNVEIQDAREKVTAKSQAIPAPRCIKRKTGIDMAAPTKIKNGIKPVTGYFLTLKNFGKRSTGYKSSLTFFSMPGFSFND